MDSFRGHSEEVKADILAKGCLFGVSLGRRAPMHRVHVDCIREIGEAGLLPIIFIGSTNGAESHLFDPVKNPLTVEQQKEQLKRAVPEAYDDSRVITLPDTGNEETWFDQFFDVMRKAGFADHSVIHYRTKAADRQKMGEAIRPLSAYMEGFAKRGLPPWESYNRDPADDEVNATEIRSFNLEALTPEQRGVMASPDYVIAIARQARGDNPDRALLEKHGIPLTVFDLALSRLWQEAGISTAAVFAATGKDNPQLGDLSSAVPQLLKDRFNGEPKYVPVIRHQNSFGQL
jgi:hypothetical protein